MSERDASRNPPSNNDDAPGITQEPGAEPAPAGGAGEDGAHKSKAVAEAAALAEAFLEQLRRGDAGIGEEAGSGSEPTPDKGQSEDAELGKKKGKKVPAKLLQQLERHLAEVEKQLAEAKAEGEKSYEARLRLQADFENYRRRSAKDKADAVQYAQEELLREMLPAIDNLERALGAASQANDVASIAEGVKITHNQILHTLAKFGVEPFSSVGTVFDPQLHDAMTQVESGDVPPGHVASEYVKGYRYKDRLLRPAMVAVAKAAPKPAPDRVALGGPAPKVSTRNGEDSSDDD
ncbi:MAG: nucleotide exchange factor GrpE [bacterium]